ncbi:MAG: tetratricopeptide repeat protein [Nitrososphaera sp.]
MSSSESDPMPLVLTVLASYWGYDLQIGEAAAAEQRNDIFSGLKYLKSLGLRWYIYESSMTNLKKRIDQRIPPIAILPGIQDTAQHANVISGFSSADRRILTYVPEPDTYGAIPESKFEDMWAQENHIAIIIIPDELRNIVERDDLPYAGSCSLYFECDSMLQRGSIEEAKAKLEKGRTEDHPLIWYLLGSIHSQNGSSEAVSCFESAVQMNPRYYLAYRALGNYFLKNKQYRKAEESYSKAIAINPARYAPIYKNRAICEIELGEAQGAKKDLLLYLEYLPNARDAAAVTSSIAQL